MFRLSSCKPRGTEALTASYPERPTFSAPEVAQRLCVSEKPSQGAQLSTTIDHGPESPRNAAPIPDQHRPVPLPPGAVAGFSWPTPRALDERMIWPGQIIRSERGTRHADDAAIRQGSIVYYCLQSDRLRHHIDRLWAVSKETVL
jgi:hypothetical protein